MSNEDRHRNDADEDDRASNRGHSCRHDLAGFSRGRLDALFDGVLAIVLTLLVFDLRAPIASSNLALARQKLRG
jgi:hypothetical protein